MPDYEKAAYEAHIAKLREALVDYDNQASEYDGRTSKELGDRIKSLLALPTNDSALMERLKQERDRCAVIAKRYEPDERADGVDYPSDAIRGLA